MSLRIEPRRDGAVLHLTLDAPKANVLDMAMMQAIEGALDAYVQPGLKAIVFEGEGRHFSTGASVPEHTREHAPKMLAKFHAMFRRLADISVPTCALVRGWCLGGGLELASWCTWIGAATDARFGQPEVKLAVFPPMASILLPWRIGGGNAVDLCVTGRTIDAPTALRMGLVTAIADDPAEWWQAFYEEHLAPASGAALRFAERAARAGLLRALDERLPEIERFYIEELMATHDANEGIAAFMDKRAPQFRHA